MLRPLTCMLTCAILTSAVHAQPLLDVTVTVDFGKDVGQNLGTLFDVRDSDGRHVAGAGFAGVVNSSRRLDRQRVQFFLKPAADGDVAAVQAMARVSEHIGTGVFDVGDEILAHDGSGVSLYRLNEQTDKWEPTTRRTYIQRIRGKVMELVGGAVHHDGREVLAAPPKGRLGSLYYGDGHIFFYHYDRTGDEKFNRICAVPWSAYDDAPADWSQVKHVEAKMLAEFAYSYGQHANAVVNCSNWGGFYVFRGGEWSVLRTPDEKTSYQIYCMINFEDRLLMGQYPAGVMFAYDGRQIEQLTDWPPVPPGVSPKLREAQSAAIYRGELFVGVWPWGELWRYDRDTQKWSMVQRMFSQPYPSNMIVHPYEEEARAAGLVHNILGQRVPALLPVRDDLLVTTASKSSWSDQMAKLTETFGAEAINEYGLIHRLHLPGNLSAVITWKDSPTVLRFVADGTRMTIHQDGEELATTSIDPALFQMVKPAGYRWGTGLFGPVGGKITAHQPQ